jgi:hypothetical protein
MKPGLLAALLFTACAGHAVESARSSAGIVVRDRDTLFAELRGDGRRGPVLFPLCAPGGTPVTRSFPFAKVAGEAVDHPHHESCWFAHGDVNGVDFWAGRGAIVAIGEPEVAAGGTELSQASEWRAPDGTVVCRDHRRWCFLCGDDWRAVDFAIELVRDDGELRLGDTKEGTMALRLATPFCLPAAGGRGTIRNSAGQRGDDVWGKPARWVAYAADIDGVRHTVALFDAPANHGHPTHWHARGYGLFAANPFGLHDFVKAPRGAGTLVLPAGQSLRLRYRIWLATGPCDDERIEAACREFGAT